jgi:hypothetical protein
VGAPNHSWVVVYPVTYWSLTVHTATLVRPYHRHFIFPEWLGTCPYEYGVRTSPYTSVPLALVPTAFQGPTCAFTAPEGPVHPVTRRTETGSCETGSYSPTADCAYISSGSGIPHAMLRVNTSSTCCTPTACPQLGWDPCPSAKVPGQGIPKEGVPKIRGLAGPRPSALQLGPPLAVVRSAPCWAICGPLCHSLENPGGSLRCPLVGVLLPYHDNNSRQLLAPLWARHLPPFWG